MYKEGKLSKNSVNKDLIEEFSKKEELGKKEELVKKEELEKKEEPEEQTLTPKRKKKTENLKINDLKEEKSVSFQKKEQISSSMNSIGNNLFECFLFDFYWFFYKIQNS